MEPSIPSSAAAQTIGIGDFSRVQKAGSPGMASSQPFATLPRYGQKSPAFRRDPGHRGSSPSAALRLHLTRFLLEAGEDVREVPLRTERPTEGRPRERAIQVMPWRSPGWWPAMKGCPGVPTRNRRQTPRHRHQVGSQCGVDRLSTRPGSNHPRARTCSNQEDRWPSWRSHRWFRRSSPALRWAARSPALPAPDQAPYPSPNRFDLSSCY